MKTKFFSLLLLVLNVSAFVNAAQPAATSHAMPSAKMTNVVSVDIDKLVEKADEFKAKREEVEAKLKVHAKPLEDIQKRVQEKQSSIEKNNAKLASGAKDMTEDAKKKINEENQKHQADIMQASQEHQGKAQEFQGKAETARQEFIKFVQDRVKEVAKGLGHDLIVFPGVSLVVNDSCDHTQKVLEVLNAEYAKKNAMKKPAAPAAAKPVAFAKKK
ncbi:OmpH family outer membrane protein [bacterium]|nr:OmpH family outer membrane protein [bacterium]